MTGVNEMDIWGYGKTPKKAFQELVDLVEMQISFAMFKEQPELIEPLVSSLPGTVPQKCASTGSLSDTF